MPQKEIPNEEIQETSSSISSSESLRRFAEFHSLPSISSSNLSDLDDPLSLNREEVMPVYERIVLPTEPSLDELLKQVAGTSELDKVTEIQIRVVSHMISLQRIHIFMPNLVSLNLDGSVITSLRDLGCEMLSLKILNISRCGLKSLDGTNGLNNVEELIADGNLIEDISPCCNMMMLKNLSLKKNQICDLDIISFLGLCPEIKVLNLMDNPVTLHADYRNSIQKSIPQLVILDDIVFFDSSTDCISELSSSEYQSSTTTSPELSFTTSPTPIIEQTNRNNKNEVDRPQSSNGLNQEVKIVKTNRPSTAAESSLTSGQPLCGNIISSVRRRRQRLAWADSLSSTSSSDSSTQNKIFPLQLPQKSIELELGVIGGTNNQKEDSTKDIQNSQSLLQAAKKWRQACQKTRKLIKDTDNMRILKNYTDK